MDKGLGIVVALILAWVFLTAAVVYNYAFARLLFVSGLEKRLPHQFGMVNKNKVPANAVLLQTGIAASPSLSSSSSVRARATRTNTSTPSTPG
jgi:amino acid transporter